MTATRQRRAWVGRVVLISLLALVATACQGTWGIRTSYRNYIAGPIASGGIETSQTATWLDGPGFAKGPIDWPIAWSEYDEATGTGTIQYRGAVRTYGHRHASGDAYVLELVLGQPRLEIDGDVGTLIADLTFRPFVGTNPPTVPPLQSVLDVEFATVDLSGADLTPDGNRITFTDAPMTGVTEAMELIGWDLFYGLPVSLDPISTTFNVNRAPQIFPQPTIAVSLTEDLKPGDEIIVWGEGFDPAANIGTRPPLAGQPAGAYAVIGRFPDTWQPSQGVASSARHVIAQKWALPAASRPIADPSGLSSVTIDESGHFEAVLTVGAGSVTTGNYGVYTYPGSGATNAAYELAIPIEVLTD